MNRLTQTAALVALATLLSAPARAGVEEALGRARTLLDGRDARAAVGVLEGALPGAGEARPRVVELLRRAYGEAARQADAAGKADEAEEYREYLAILNRKSPPAAATPSTAPKPAPAMTPAPASAAPRPQPAPVPGPDAGPPPLLPPADEPSPELRFEPPAPLPSPVAPAFEGPDARPAPDSPPEPGPTPTPEPEPDPLPPPTAGPDPLAEPPPAAAPTAPAPSPEPARPGLAEADAAFLAKRYEEAGRIYAELAREGTLPTARNDHWAYCRWFEVVRRINARPSSETEWASIDEEIARIRQLSPKNWYGEYLRRRAAERTPGLARGNPGQGVVIRGSSPEETRPAPTPTRVPAPAPASPPAPATAPARPAPEAPPAPQAGAVSPRGWQVFETANFRVHHEDPEQARRVAEVAERTREAQVRRWTGSGTTGSPWSPRCDIYLYPTASVFREMTGQPEDSPGFSTMGVQGGKVIARRVNLRVDHPTMLDAVLPHEVTHVVLADLFTAQQVPRWADEGMAVLSEPDGEQQLRAADLEAPLAAGRLFRIEDLMGMDYPDGQHWGLYYAQSVSLTRFLVEQGTPARFIEFLRGSQAGGIEAELRRLYNIDGYADLQDRWIAWARAAAATTRTASAAEPGEVAGRRE